MWHCRTVWTNQALASVLDWMHVWLVTAWHECEWSEWNSFGSRHPLPTTLMYILCMLSLSIVSAVYQQNNNVGQRCRTAMYPSTIFSGSTGKIVLHTCRIDWSKIGRNISKRSSVVNQLRMQDVWLDRYTHTKDRYGALVWTVKTHIQSEQKIWIVQWSL